MAIISKPTACASEKADTSPRPIPIEPQFDRVPIELRDRAQWVVWRYCFNGKKWTKVPFNAESGDAASTTDPKTWTTFDSAVRAYQQGRDDARPYDGIGYVFADDDPYCGADLDHCFDEFEDEKVLQPSAVEWIERFNSYTEFSVSGAGLHVIMKAKPSRNFKNDQAGREMYNKARYFTFTGDSYHEPPMPITERQDEADAFVAEYSPRKKTGPKTDRQSNGHAGGQFATWDALRAELGRRIAAHESAHKNGSGKYDCRGICHDGEGDSGIFYDPSTNQAHCNKGCDQATMLRAFGLPDAPDLARKASAPRAESKVDPAPEPPAWEPEPADEFESADEIDTVFDDENLHADHGNTARFLNAYRSKTRYIYARKKFMCFDDRRWSDDQGIVEDRANRIVDRLRNIPSILNPMQQKEGFKHYINSQKPERRNAMLTLARAEIRIEAEAFDADPELFNVANGTIHLPTGELRPHRPSDYCSKISKIKFDPHAKCPLWLEFLRGIFNDDADLIAFIQRAVGYSLSGLTYEQVLFLLYGIGKNGKSTLVKVLERLIGEYATHAQMETFSAQNRAGNGHNEDLARLRGARLVTAVESQESKRLDEGLIKQVTGGDRVTASYKHEHTFEYTPQYKLWLAANHKPIIRGTDEGIWRRPLLIPFLVQFEKDETKVMEGKKLADTKIEAKLLAELPGILNWACEGFRTWNDNGLNPPASVINATEKYREESDLLGAFIAENLEKRKPLPSEPAGEGATKIYKAYSAWLEENGERAITQTRFAANMTERGHDKKRDSKTGISLYTNMFFLPGKATQAEGSEGSEGLF